MLTIDWPYQNELVHCVDYDRDYYYGKLIDIGWDYYDSTVHSWVGALNKLAYQIYQQQTNRSNHLRMNQTTYDALQLAHNEYFNGDNNNVYRVTIEPSIGNDQIQVCIDEQWMGQLNIVRT